MTHYRPDPLLTDFQTLTNSPRSYEPLALRLLGLITYRSHIRSRTLTSSGVSQWEALCGYSPSFMLRMPTFNNEFARKSSRWRGNMRRQMAFKFRLPLELLLASGEDVSAIMSD